MPRTTPRGWRPGGPRPRAARRGRGRRQRRHPTVGYGHPPEAHRFTSGQSGNPRGRPKGATARTPARRLTRLATIVLEEASRQIPVRDGNRTVTLSMQQAIIHRLAVDAAKGNPRAQRLFTEMLALSEDEAQRTAEQPRPTFKIVIVDPKAPQADDDAEEGS